MTAFPDKTLEVLIAGVPAGYLHQHASGGLSFTYRTDYRGTPLSLSMPVANTTYGDKKVRPYLFGLLPDDRATRRALGNSLDVSGDNPFALLSVMGLDCPGAVQVCASSGVKQAVKRNQKYVPITPEEIEGRLQHLSTLRSPSWQAPSEHWSLGGQQAKMALARFDDAWFQCNGAAATTHIVKPGIPHLMHQALNEHFCLRLANACGVNASHSEFVLFGNVPAIVVERYDRIVEEPFRVTRLHQEDLCQALGVLPENKYASEGGPSARDVAALLARHPRAQENKIEFAAQLFFNYLIGAPDAHAKNYSILLGSTGTPTLAPLYDVASGLPYKPERGTWRSAMSIGGQNEFGRVRGSNVRRFAEAASIEPGLAVDLMGNLAKAVLREMPGVAREVSSIEGGPDLAQRLQEEIAPLCERTLAML
ncbi:MAG: type II toxin-antitoxin system HipA family toxin [Eggerthellaceae bacterium]|nr:type II toxin-antitoxin system HipA family toxin [Eggerthellaceae bacterium]